MHVASDNRTNSYAVRRTSLFALLTLLSLVLPGCSGGERARLVGTWKLQTAQSLAKRIGGSDAKSAAANEQKVEDANQDADIEQARMLVEFRRNGVLLTGTHMGSIQRNKKGTWELVEFDPQSNIAKVKCKIGLQTSEHEIKFIEDGLIEMEPPNMAGLKTKFKFEKTDRAIGD